MIDLHIHTSTPDELVQSLRLLSGIATVDVTTSDTPVPVVVTDENVSGEELEGTVSELPSRDETEPAKMEAQDIPELQTEEPDTEPEEATDEPPKATMEEARAALNSLRERKGSAAVRTLLNRHKVSSFIDLPTTQYPTIIKEANDYE